MLPIVCTPHVMADAHKQPTYKFNNALFWENYVYHTNFSFGNLGTSIFCDQIWTQRIPEIQLRPKNSASLNGSFGKTEIFDMEISDMEISENLIYKRRKKKQ